MSVEYKGVKGRFASLNCSELISEVRSRFEGQYDITTRVMDRGHTKAAQRVGGGERTIITLRDRTPVDIGGDVVYPQIVVRDQSYPGSALTVSFGLYRLVCSNGLMAFSHVATPVSIPHFKNRTDTLIYLTDQIEGVASKIVNIVADVQQKQALPVANPVDMIKHLPLPKSVKKEAIARINAGLVRPEDDINTQWGLYNFVNEIDRIKARRNSTAYLDRDQRFTFDLPLAA